MSNRTVRYPATNDDVFDDVNNESENNQDHGSRKRTASAARQRVGIQRDSPTWDIESPQKRSKQSRHMHANDDNSDGEEDVTHDTVSPVRVRPRQLSFGSAIEPSEPTTRNTTEDDPPYMTNKRIRRLTEKALYNSKRDQNEEDDGYVEVNRPMQESRNSSRAEPPPAPKRRSDTRGRALPPTDHDFVVSPTPFNSDDNVVEPPLFETDEDRYNDANNVQHGTRQQYHASNDSRGNFLLPPGRYSYSAGGKGPKAKKRAVDYNINNVPEESEDEKTTPSSSDKNPLRGGILSSPPSTPSPRKPNILSTDDSAVKRMRVLNFDGKQSSIAEAEGGRPHSHSTVSAHPNAIVQTRPQQVPIDSNAQVPRNKSALTNDTVYLSDIDPRSRSKPKAQGSHVEPTQPTVEAPTGTNNSQVGQASTASVSLTVNSRDPSRDVSGCPDIYLVDNGDGTSSPAEVGLNVLQSVTGYALETLHAFLGFQGMRPFASVSSIPKEIVFDSKRSQFVWGTDRVAIYAIAGSVVSCNVVNPTTVMPANYDQRELKIVPYGDQWRNLMVHLGAQLKTSTIMGPYDYGCILTLSGRRSGFSSNDGAPTIGLKKSMFSSSRQSVSAAWFEARLPSCVDFDKRIPLYDGRNRGFSFERADFAEMQNLPIYQENGMMADFPTNTIVIAFFALATWRDKNRETSLSFNLHSVLGLGDPDEYD